MKVNPPGDRYEREADRIADAVVRGPAEAPPAPLAVQRLPAGGVQRLALSALDEDEEELLQAKGASGRQPRVAPGTAARIQELRGGGQPLPPPERRFFESRFGHDFGRVRVHTDARAAGLAHAVNALAFTVGRDVVFGSGAYAPGTDAGRRLIAHELTHVIQQGANGPAPAAPAVLQRQGADAAPANVPATGTPNQAGGTSTPCEPNRALTWSDFTGQPPQSTFAAETHYSLPKSTSGGSTTFKAKFDGSASWCKPKWKKPADRTVNGCAPPIRSCKDWLRKNPGGTWSFDGKASTKCPASPVPSASVVATTVGECDSKIGAECDRASGLESARLLQHEQLHFDIGCVLVKKANQALAAGSAEATVERELKKKDAAQSKAYDTETKHGCIAAKQTAWTTAVGNGLPGVTIP
ncbi:MAG: DUF4157 domain-containing protein [Rhodothermales bacterium]|nr:DUF4157 domain-containing protein [Rhodothermales bacterium]